MGPEGERVRGMLPGPALTARVHGGLAQPGERLVCNQEVTGSIPVSSTIACDADE